MNLEKKTWAQGTKYGVENLELNECKVVLSTLNRVRSAITMHVKRNKLDMKFRTLVNKKGGVLIVRIK
jgi:hypothetical protein